MNGGGLEALIDAAYGSWAVIWPLLLQAIAEISVVAMAEDTSMLACVQGSSMYVGILQVILAAAEQVEH